MQKIEYISHLYHTVLFFCSIFTFPKEVRLNSAYYLIMKIHNKRELQNITTMLHSADIDYKDVMKIYKHTKNV